MRRSIIFIGILLLVGLLGAAVYFQRAAPAASPTGGVAQTQVVDAFQVTIQLDDSVPGERVMNVLVQDAAGATVDARAVRLRFSMAEMDMGATEIEATRIAPGQFRASGSFFTMVGRWNVDATVIDAATQPHTVAFAFPIAAPGEASGPLNPLGANAATLAAAGPLYQRYCATCHGTTGKGDGEAAVGLRPAPSDFSQHMQLGKHTDGQIFLWIRDGYPGTAMPAWGQQLSDEQIWQLVTFLRTFGQTAPNVVGDATATPAPAPTTASAITEPLPPLVFVRAGNLWRSNGQGAPQPITALDAKIFAEYPTMAPNGGQIAFVTTTQGPLGEDSWPLDNPTTSLYVSDADGGNPRPLWKPERGRIGLTAWSPDGAAVVVGFYDLLSDPNAPVRQRIFQIVQVDVRSGARTILLNDAYDPTFAPDGTQIAYLRWHADLAAFTLNVAAPDGTNEREVIPWGSFPSFYAPRLAPDGRRIIFTSTGGPPVDDQGFPIKAGTQSPLDQLLGFLAPSVAEAHGAASELWIVNTDGSGLRRLTALREDTPMAVFSADGTEIILMGAGGIYRMQTDGTQLRKIDPLGDHGGLDWGR